MHRIIIVLLLIYLHPFKHFISDKFHNNILIDKRIQRNLIQRFNLNK